MPSVYLSAQLTWGGLEWNNTEMISVCNYAHEGFIVEQFAQENRYVTILVAVIHRNMTI